MIRSTLSCLVASAAALGGAVPARAIAPNAAWILVAGESPTAVAVADLDADGVPDVAVANYLTNDVTWFRGPLEPTSEVTGTLAAGQAPVALSLADVDGDGAPDVTAASSIDARLVIWFGDGKGGFAVSSEVDLGCRPTSLASGDLDDDGASDLLVGCEDRPTVVVHGDTARRFGRRDAFGDATAALSILRPEKGRASVLTLSSGDDELLRWDLPEAKAPAQRMAVPAGPISVVPWPPDGPPRSVAVVSELADAVVRFAVEDDGALSLEGLADDCPRPVAVAAFPSESTPAGRFAATCQGEDTLLIVGGPGVESQRIPARSAPSSLAVADVTGDGRVDLVVGEAGADGVTIHPGRSDGTFAAPARRRVAGSLHDIALLPGWNGRGADVLAADQSTGELVIVEPAGLRAIPAPPAPGVEAGAVAPWIAVASPSVVAEGPAFLVGWAASVGAWERGEDGSFSEAARHPGSLPVRQAVLVDLDEDGLLDLVGRRAGLLMAFRGTGGSGFAPLSAARVPAGAAGLRAVGRSVITVVGVEALRFEVQGGELALAARHALAEAGLFHVFADLNRDGQVDAAFVTADRRDVVVQPGNDAGFGEPRRLASVAEYGESLAAADVDGDGRLDLAVANVKDASVAVWRGVGDGLDFERGASLATSRRPVSVHALGSDGKPSELITAHLDGTVTWLQGARSVARTP